MELNFTLQFFANFGWLLWEAAPVLLSLLITIGLLAVAIGRQQGLSVGDSLYLGFITATTVGYGDLRPTHPRGKVLAIVIAFLGLVLTGIIVALSVHAVATAYKEHGTATRSPPLTNRTPRGCRRPGAAGRGRAGARLARPAVR